MAHQPYDPIFAEVDADVRREKLKAFARTTGRWVLLISAIILVGTIGLVGWQRYHEEQSRRLTALMIDAGQKAQADPNDAVPILRQVAEAGHPKLSPLARLWLGQILMPTAPDEARKWLAPLLSSPPGDDPYRQFAQLLAADPKTLAALPADVGGPFAHTARELRAVSLLDLGKRGEAAKAFAALADDATAPPTIRERANLLLSTRLAGDAVAAPATPK